MVLPPRPQRGHEEELQGKVHKGTQPSLTRGGIFQEKLASVSSGQFSRQSVCSDLISRFDNGSIGLHS